METVYNIKDYEEHYGRNSYYNNPLVYRRFLSKIILHAEGNNILDIGCGSSFFGRCCNMFGFNYLGLDLSETAMADCGKHNIPFIKTDLSKGLPEGIGKFDIIALHCILEHLPFDVDCRILKEMKKYNKTNSIYSFQIPTYDSGYKKHLTIKSYNFWKKHLDSYGYKIIDRYNWSFGKIYYYISRIIDWSPIISQMNVICKLK